MGGLLRTHGVKGTLDGFGASYGGTDAASRLTTAVILETGPEEATHDRVHRLSLVGAGLLERGRNR